MMELRSPDGNYRCEFEATPLSGGLGKLEQESARLNAARAQILSAGVYPVDNVASWRRAYLELVENTLSALGMRNVGQIDKMAHRFPPTPLSVLGFSKSEALTYWNQGFYTNIMPRMLRFFEVHRKSFDAPTRGYIADLMLMPITFGAALKDLPVKSGRGTKSISWDQEVFEAICTRIEALRGSPLVSESHASGEALTAGPSKLTEALVNLEAALQAYVPDAALQPYFRDQVGEDDVLTAQEVAERLQEQAQPPIQGLRALLADLSAQRVRGRERALPVPKGCNDMLTGIAAAVEGVMAETDSQYGSNNASKTLQQALGGLKRAVASRQA